MKRFALKTVTWYAIIGLLVAVAFLPILKAMAPEYFPSFTSNISGFRDLDCKGMTCNEGQFCKDSKCINVMAPNTLGVPVGNE